MNDQPVSDKSDRKQLKRTNFLLMLAVILGVVFIPVSVLMFTGAKELDAGQGLNWLYRDSAFFTLIMALIGYVIVYNFNHHQDVLRKRIDDLDKKVQLLESDKHKKDQQIEDIRYILNKVIEDAFKK